MSGRAEEQGSGRRAPLRICARPGCGLTVKKRTAKYCSVRCCSLDPARHERLRQHARRAGRSDVLPLAAQLSWDLFPPARDPEAQIAPLCEGREDVPVGMSRFAG